MALGVYFLPDKLNLWSKSLMSFPLRSCDGQICGKEDLWDVCSLNFSSYCCDISNLCRSFVRGDKPRLVIAVEMGPKLLEQGTPLVTTRMASRTGPCCKRIIFPLASRMLVCSIRRRQAAALVNTTRPILTSHGLSLSKIMSIWADLTQAAGMLKAVRLTSYSRPRSVTR